MLPKARRYVHLLQRDAIAAAELLVSTLVPPYRISTLLALLLVNMSCLHSLLLPCSISKAAEGAGGCPLFWANISKAQWPHPPAAPASSAAAPVAPEAPVQGRSHGSTHPGSPQTSSRYKPPRCKAGLVQLPLEEMSISIIFSSEAFLKLSNSIVTVQSSN